MIGSWKLNVLFGGIAFIFGFFLSLVNNMWLTSLFRALIGFILFWGLGYVVRFILFQLGTRKSGDNQHADKNGNESEFTVETKPDESVNTVSNQAVSDGKELKDEASFQAIPLHALHKGKTEEQSN
ncbi:hypothetical protein [Bacillus rubiinfantis]|uniref:hypothetical protein n=1 Tax=Bacillus rubiinfantis TaxID=1499680 RepID=UPI0005A787D2|nr:hypothetical protein [Bacillus rubiinfantis]